MRTASSLVVVLLTAFTAMAQEPGPPAPAPVPAPATQGAPDLSVQEWLLARRKHEDYEKATFSFEHGVRDDPDLAITRNDWDLSFGNDGGSGPDTFEVRMVRDDISLIADLGELAWGELDPAKASAVTLLTRVETVAGHVYLVHTMDTGGESWALFRVLVHRAGDSVRIEWVAFDPRGLRTSPGLSIDRAVELRLNTFRRAVERQGGLTPCLRQSEQASERTFDLLDDTRVRDLPAEFGELLDRLAELPNVKIRLPRVDAERMAEWRAAEIPFDVRIRTLEGALEAVTRALRLHWVVRTDGSLAIRRV